MLGGYGAVGRTVAGTLARWYPGEVVVAGRRLDRARALAAAVPGVVPMRVEVGEDADLDRALAGAGVVVMCVEPGGPRVARACLDRGIHYLDVSATAAELEAIARLHPRATRRGATAVLSVGLAPGVSTLLARECAARLPGPPAGVDITILGGLGERHGDAGLAWVADHLVRAPAADPARPQRARPDLPGFGRRSAYRFAFSDEETLSAALGVPVATRLCFDSAPVTRLMFGLRRAGVFAALRPVGGTALLTAIFGRARFGSDRFVVHVRARDAAGSAVEAALTGRGEARATGQAAALVARRLRTAPAAPGVVHIDEVVDALPYLDELTGLDASTGGAGALRLHRPAVTSKAGASARAGRR